VRWGQKGAVQRWAGLVIRRMARTYALRVQASQLQVQGHRTHTTHTAGRDNTRLSSQKQANVAVALRNRAAAQ
jgi:hypothetical protein